MRGLRQAAPRFLYCLVPVHGCTAFEKSLLFRRAKPKLEMAGAVRQADIRRPTYATCANRVWLLDSTLAEEFKITETKRLKFKMESDNLTNSFRRGNPAMTAGEFQILERAHGEINLKADAASHLRELDGRFVRDAADGFNAIAAGRDGDFILAARVEIE